MKKYILVAILIIVVLVGGYVGARMGLSGIRSNTAENGSERFIKKLYSEYTLVGISCQGEDTDGDKYISCDARLKSPENLERVVHLQCPSVVRSFLGLSCKEARVGVIQ